MSLEGVGRTWQLPGEVCCGQGRGRDGQWCAGLSPCLGPQPPRAACVAALTLFSVPPPQVEGFRVTVAQRLVRMLQICAGHVPGVSALNLLSLMSSSENPFVEGL